jgi:hypothetical protein
MKLRVRNPYRRKKICLWCHTALTTSKKGLLKQVWKDKRLVQMISMIHEATTVNTGWKDKKTNMKIQKPYAVVQYNKFINSINRADQ